MTGDPQARRPPFPRRTADVGGLAEGEIVVVNEGGRWVVWRAARTPAGHLVRQTLGPLHGFTGRHVAEAYAGRVRAGGVT